MPTLAERMKAMRELRLVVPDARAPSVRRRVARQVARLHRGGEARALAWIETVSEFDEPEDSTKR